jgi:response regulator RpfG family c-di-GMP phosphodiesterase
MSNNGIKKTVLIVNSDVDVLVMMNGILQNDYRVLVATDAETAVRLLTLPEVTADLAVMDRNVPSSATGELQSQIAEISPRLRTISTASWVEDGMIRLQTLSASGERLTESLIQNIHSAIAAPKVMVAGRV